MPMHYTSEKESADRWTLPSIETFYVHAMPRRAYDRTYAADICRGEYGEGSGCEGNGCEHCPAAGWYWQTCLPGCMPDSEPFGPFDTEGEALADAREGYDDDDETKLYTWQVVVGNVGTVYSGDDEAAARQCAADYVDICRAGNSRAEFPVVLWKNDEPAMEWEENE